MGIRFEPLSDANADAVRRLVTSIWGARANDSFAAELFDWRYRARPAGDTQIALDGERCIGIIDSLLRPYLRDGRVISVRETCDWFCLPKYRPLGVGAALMRRFMARPEPILSIGGTKQTHALLQRLKWQRLTDMREYVLPLKARAFAAWAVRGFKLGNGKIGSWLPAALPLRPLRRAGQPGPGARVETMAGRGDTFDPLPEGYTLVELLGEGDRHWLSTGPGWSGLLLGLQFAIDGVPVGISLSRLEPYFVGTAGKILHLQVASRLQSVVDWIVAETAQRLVERRAEILFCRASSPMIAQALRGAGFIGAQPRAVYWWPAADAPLTGTTSLTYLRADDAVPFDLLAQPPSGFCDLAAAGTRETGWGHVSSEAESRRSHS